MLLNGQVEFMNHFLISLIVKYYFIANTSVMGLDKHNELSFPSN